MPLPHQNDRLPGLEAARFLLSLSVVLYHFFHRGDWSGAMPPGLAGGEAFFYGRYAVPAFFVISGYVIALSAAGKSARAFAAARLSRLAPSIWTCAGLTALVLLAGGAAPGEVAGRWLQTVSFLGLLRGADFIDPSYWSLTAELHFYLGAALLLLSGSLRRLAPLLTLLGLLWLAALISPYRGALPEAAWAAQYAPFFAIGVILRDMEAPGAARSRLRALLALNILIGWAGLTLYWPPYGPEKSVAGVALACLAITLVAAALIPAFGALRLSGWRAELARLGGRLSFPLYLAHQLAGYEAAQAAYALTGSAPLAAAAALALAFAMAAFAALAVEPWACPPLRRALSARR